MELETPQVARRSSDEFNRLWTIPDRSRSHADWLQRYDEAPAARDARHVQSSADRDRDDHGWPPTGGRDETVIQPWSVQDEALSRSRPRLASTGTRPGWSSWPPGSARPGSPRSTRPRPEFARVLFVAHREEILRQARDVFRQIRPAGRLTLLLRRRARTGRRRRVRERAVAPPQPRRVRSRHVRLHRRRRVPSRHGRHLSPGDRPLPARVPPRAHRHARPCRQRRSARAVRRQPRSTTAGWSRASRGDCSARSATGPSPTSPTTPQIPWRNGRFDPEALTAQIATQRARRPGVRRVAAHSAGPSGERSASAAPSPTPSSWPTTSAQRASPPSPCTPARPPRHEA